MQSESCHHPLILVLRGLEGPELQAEDALHFGLKNLQAGGHLGGSIDKTTGS